MKIPMNLLPLAFLPKRWLGVCLVLGICLSTAAAVYARTDSASKPLLSIDFSYLTDVAYGISTHRTGWDDLLNAQVAFAIADETRLVWAGSMHQHKVWPASEAAHLGVVDDRQCYSNFLAAYDTDWGRIYTMTLGLSQTFDRWRLFLGCNHINDDIFATPYSAFFTASSNGIFPVVGDNFGIGNYPNSAFCFQADWQSDRHFGVFATLSRNCAADRLEDFINFDFRRKGIVGLAEFRWVADPEDEWAGSWHLGGIGHLLEPEEWTAEWQSLGVEAPQAAVFAYGEQPVWHSANERHMAGLLLQVGTALSSRTGLKSGLCQQYWGAGLYGQSQVSERLHEYGLVLNRARYFDGQEWDLEFSYAVPVIDHLCIHPSFHLIRTDGQWNPVALLRFCIE